MAQIADACRCDPRQIRRIKDHPEKARFAGIGHIDPNNQKIIHIEHSWTDAPSSIESRSRSTCSLDLEANRTYLIWSSLSVAAARKTGDGFTICDTVTKELPEAAAEVAALSVLDSGKHGVPNPSWFFCQKDSECAVDAGICGKPESVNQKYERPFEDWVRARMSLLDCENSPTAAVASTCRDGLCVVTKTMNRSERSKP